MFESRYSDGPLRDQTVLVTGGAGFIGSHLADALVGANEVRLLDDFSTGTAENVPAGVRTVDGDVRDPETVGEAMAGVDTVFHLAALVSVEQSVAEPLVSHGVNVDGTLAVLEAARETDSRVVAVSSAAIYGRPEPGATAEDAPLRPTSPYGVDKLAVDHYTRLFADLYGLSAVVVRPFNVYGPRQTASDYSGVISVFLDQARRGDPLTVHGDGEQTRDFVHVSDVVAALLAAADADVTGEAYNVGTGTSVTIRELAERVVEVTGADSDVVHDDPRPGDVRHSRADISKARRDLGYEPSVTLRDGLATLVA